MTIVLVILVILIVASVYLARFHFASFLFYLSAKLEPRGNDLEILGSLRQSLVHERKKKTAGLEMILSSWEKGEEIQSRYDYFQELLHQLNDLVISERRNLMALTPDIFLWAKLRRMLRRIEKVSRQKKERVEIKALKENLTRLKKLVEKVVEDATERFSFSLNDAVRESLKIVRIEKSQSSDIKIEESLDAIGDNIRFSYTKFKDWQRLLTNLIRNSVEAVEVKQSGGVGVAAPPAVGLGGEESLWVKVSTQESDPGRAGAPDLREDESSVSRRQGSQPCTEVVVIIEDSGIGMDEATRTSFFKKGFTSGKEHGLGLGVTEESIQFVEKFGNWQIESQKGKGTRVAIYIDQEKASKGELVLPKEKPFYRTKLAFGLYIFLFILIGLALLFTFDKYKRIWVDWNPVSAKVEGGKLLIVHNKDGDELWRRRFIREIKVYNEFDREKRMEVLKQSVHIDDVDSDGKNEMLIGFLESESETGFLLCLDYRGNELWCFSFGMKEIYERGGQIFGPPNDVFVVDVDQDGDKEIIFSSNCRTWFPCQLVVLGNDGKKEGEYWHSGHLAIQFIKDMDMDGEQEIVCGGGNNHMGASPVVLILDGKNVMGQSPPYRSNVFPKAKEEVYVKIPRLWDISTNVGLYPQGGIYYNGTGDDYEEYVLTVDDYIDMRREYVVDQYLQPKRNVTFTPTFHDEWARLKQAGLIDFDVTPEVIEKWMKLERWENGVKVK
jgi:signal transduction histidine kinase